MVKVIKLTLLITIITMILYSHGYHNYEDDKNFQSTFGFDTIKVPEIPIEHFKLNKRDTTPFKGKYVNVEPN